MSARYSITEEVRQVPIGGQRLFFVRKGYDTAFVDLDGEDVYCLECRGLHEERRACRHALVIRRALKSGRLPTLRSPAPSPDPSHV